MIENFAIFQIIWQTECALVFSRNLCIIWLLIAEVTWLDFTILIYTEWSFFICIKLAIESMSTMCIQCTIFKLDLCASMYIPFRVSSNQMLPLFLELSTKSVKLNFIAIQFQLDQCHLNNHFVVRCTWCLWLLPQSDVSLHGLSSPVHQFYTLPDG